MNMTFRSERQETLADGTILFTINLQRQLLLEQTPMMKESFTSSQIRGKVVKIDAEYYTVISAVVDTVAGETYWHPICKLRTAEEAAKEIEEKPGKSLGTWAKAIHKSSKERGIWPTYENGEPIKRPRSEVYMCFIQAITEAHGLAQKDLPPAYYPEFDRERHLTALGDGVPMKPEGEAVSLAECVMNIMDYFESKGWSLDDLIQMRHDYQMAVSRHSGRKS